MTAIKQTLTNEGRENYNTTFDVVFLNYVLKNKLCNKIKQNFFFRCSGSGEILFEIVDAALFVQPIVRVPEIFCITHQRQNIDTVISANKIKISGHKLFST
jgi:hypothetical protein